MLAGVFGTLKPGFAILTSLVRLMSKAIDPSTRVQLSIFDFMEKPSSPRPSETTFTWLVPITYTLKHSWWEEHNQMYPCGAPEIPTEADVLDWFLGIRFCDWKDFDPKVADAVEFFLRKRLNSLRKKEGSSGS